MHAQHEYLSTWANTFVSGSRTHLGNASWAQMLVPFASSKALPMAVISVISLTSYWLPQRKTKELCKNLKT